jgi:peptidyl-prolyl cis-trans isomerase SurA
MIRTPYKYLLLLTVVAFAAACAFAGDTVIEEIVARVNNQIITRSELNRSRDQMLNDRRQQESEGVAATHSVDDEKNLLRDLIDQQLMLQKGQDEGITGDTELVKKLDELRKQMNLDSLEALEKEAQKQGLSYEEFKQNMRNNIITQTVIQRDVASHIAITPEEITQYYDAHKAEMEQPEAVRLSEILITPPTKPGEDPTPDDVTAAQDKAKEALAEVKQGKSFSDVAKKYSDGPSASQGGDLGYFKRGTLAKELEDKTFVMKPGNVTDVIQTKQGFVVLKVDEHRQAGVPPKSAVEGQINEQLYYQKLQPALRTYLTKLREDAYIDIKPGYVDTGASPNETKPVITNSATPDKTKEKTKKKKKLLVF